MRAQMKNTMLGLLAIAMAAACGQPNPARTDALVPAAKDPPPKDPSGDLDQCANGPLDAPVTCTTDAAWQNGNLNKNQAHYFEGGSLPYRLVMADVPTTGSNTVAIEWDTTATGSHAIDYLTSYDRTETTANPCVGVAGCSTFSTFPIPIDANVTAGPDGIGGTADDIVQIPGVFTLFGGTITSVSAYTLTGTYAGSSSTSITITFTATTATPVLAWGGHISLRSDWTPQPTASDIDGSPYHTALLSIDGKPGRQDRSLQAGAVHTPPTLLVIKNVVNDNGGTAVPADFTMQVTGNGPSPASFAGSTTGTLVTFAGGGAYSVGEIGPGGYSASYSDDCTGTLAIDESKTCTVTNDDADRCAGVICDVPDQCHEIAVCNPETGRCGVQAPKPDGTPCNDENACTVDTCQKGVCVGVPLDHIAPTRTAGFFMNHESALAQCLASGPVILGELHLSTLEQGLGLLWAVPLRFPDTGLRSPFDRAALHVLRQALVATCNHRLFGAVNGALVDAAVAAVEGTDCSHTLGALEVDLLLANDAGLAQPLPPGFHAGPITPSHARSIADDTTSHFVNPLCTP